MKSLTENTKHFWKEWNITYSIHDGEGGKDEFFVILPSFGKVLWWFVTRGRRACEIYIWTSGQIKQYKEES